jgi:hypothetical protein
MAKTRKKQEDNDLDELPVPQKRDYKIIGATIKDDLCNYQYEVTSGIGIGDQHGVKGKGGFIKDTLKSAFAALNVHMAFNDDIFKHSGIVVENIDQFHNHDHTFLFTTTGFKISGGEENENIVLIGTKYLSSNNRIPYETPKIPIYDSSSYQWYNELKAAADKVREEVALYSEGNYIPIEIEEEQEDPSQLKMSFKAVAAAGDDQEFINAEV